MNIRHSLGWAGVAVLAASALLAACSPVTALNAITPSSTYILDEGVAWGTGPRAKLDVYTPAGMAPAGGWPMVVFYYGGSWNMGERADYRFVGEALASRGILTVVPDYRLYPEVRYPDFLRDNAQALAFAIEQAGRYGANPRRIHAMGHSAGGYNAAMLALDARWLRATGHAPSELAGWIGLAGPYDFYPISNADAKPVFHHPNYPPDSQPIGFAAAGSPAAFLGAALKDDLVNPQRNTQQMATRLRAAGVPVSLQFYERVNHITLLGAMAAPLRWLAPVLDDVASFVQAAPPRDRAATGRRAGDDDR